VRLKKSRKRKADTGWQSRDWTFESAVRTRRSVRPSLRRAKRPPPKARPRKRRTYSDVAGARALRGPLVIPSRARLKALAPRLPGLLALAFWVWLILWVSLSDAYYVPPVEVRGNEVVATEQLVAQAGVPSGYHVFFVNPFGVKARLLELPGIRDVSVECRLPGQVLITVSERTPVYNWQVGGQLFWVDDDGMLLAASGPLHEALTVAEHGETARQPGDRLDTDVIQALEQLKQLLPDVQQYEYTPESGLSFHTAEGIKVFLGTNDLSHRVRGLRGLLQEVKIRGDQPSEIHVEFRYPVVK